MIAVSSSGKSFRSLARYLEHGRDGVDTGRIAWSEGRNIATNRPELAAEIMHVSASNRDERVAQPVFHVVVSFDPQDRPTDAQMRQVADRLLADLGLSQHQSLIVAHQDRAHRHVHIVVNRIHPETGVAWDRWQQQARTQQSLRTQERELGFREVSGRLYQVEGTAPPERAVLSNAELRQRTRTSEPVFVERVRSGAATLRMARSWDALETALAERGLRLERKGQGLIITDGQREVKASRVHRDLSLRQLELRYGVRYIDRDRAPAPNRSQEQRAAPQSAERGQLAVLPGELDTLRVRYVAGRIRHFEQAIRVEHALSAAGTALDRADARLRVHHASIADREAARTAFARSLRNVYRDPTSARDAFGAAVARDGAETAIRQLRENSESLGSLAVAQRRPGVLGRIGIGRTPSGDVPAREAVARAVDCAERMIAAERAVPSRVEQEGVIASLATARRRYEHLREVAERLPLRSRMAGNVARGIERLTETEWVALHRTLTPREAAIGTVFREAVAHHRLQDREHSFPSADPSNHSPRARHTRSRTIGAAVHRVLTYVAPRELRQMARAVEALGNPGMALKRAIVKNVREAILGAREYER